MTIKKLLWEQLDAEATIHSPYHDVTDSEWWDAYEYASDKIYEEDEVERKPTVLEVENAMARLTELRKEDSR